MRSLPRSIPLLWCCLSFILSLSLFAATEGQAVLSRNQVPAGQTKAIISLMVSQIGRYAIESESREPCQLSIVGKMQGELQTASGRLDLFLEPGEYQIRLAKAAADSVSLRCSAFMVLNGRQDFSGLSWLPGIGGFSGQLHDREILAWWVHIDAGSESSNNVLVEALGRSLGGLALWRDGMWDTGLAARFEAMPANPNRPLRLADLRGRLETGNYLLICWGAPREKWGDNSGEEPVWVRSALPNLGSFGQAEHKIGPSGLDEYLVEPGCSQARIESIDAAKMALWFASPASTGNRLSETQNRANKKDLFISCHSSVYGPKILLVMGQPGSSYRLSYGGDASGDQQQRWGINDSAQNYLVSAMLMAKPDDETSLGFLALLRAKGEHSVLAGLETLPQITASNGFRQKLNNLGPNSFIIRVQGNLDLTVREKSAEVSASYSFTPLVEQLNGKAAKALEVVANQNFKLGSGVYLMRLKPLKRGILEFTLQANGAVAGKPALILPGASYVVPGSRPNNNLFALLQNATGNEITFSQRALPADPVSPVGLWLMPKQSLTIPLKLGQAMSFGLAGEAVSLQVDGSAWLPATVYPAGLHSAQLISANPQPVFVLLSGMPIFDQAPPPKPSLDSGLRQIDDKATHWDDIAKDQTLRYALRVDQAGLYRLETEGRIFTNIVVRGQLAVSLFEASSSDNSPNTALQAYLAPGLYLVALKGLGASSGHLGLGLRRLDTLAESALSPDGIIRTTVPAQSALSIPIRVGQAGDYAIRTWSLGRNFQTRLEDEAGFPVLADSSKGDFSLNLDPGQYRYLSYPSDFQTLRLVMLEPQTVPTAPAGGKATALEFNRPLAGLWRETPGRPETVFSGRSPVDNYCLLYVSAGMSYSLVSKVDGSVLAEGDNGCSAVQVKLPAGDFELRVRSTEENNDFHYGVLITSIALLAGETRHYQTAANQIPLIVGEDGYYELWSLGDSEIEAELYAVKDMNLGDVVARSAPIANDWNFSLLSYLTKGIYLLNTKPLGQSMANPARQDPLPDQGRQSQRDEESSEGEDRGEAEGDSGEGEGEYAEGEYREEGGPQISEDEASEGFTEEEPVDRPSPSASTIMAGLMSHVPPDAGPIAIQLVARPQKNLQWKLPELQAGLAFALGAEVLSASFTADKTGPYTIGVKSDSQIRMELRGKRGLIASGVNQLAVVLEAKAEYSLRCWKIGQASITVTLQIKPMDQPGLSQVAVTPGLVVTLPPDGRKWRVAGGPNQEFVALTDNEAFASAGAVCWVAPEPSETANPLAPVVQAATPAQLSGGQSLSIKIMGDSATLPLEVAEGQVALVSALGQGYLGGLSIGTPGGKAVPGYSWAGVALQETGAQRLVAAGKYQALVWSAEPGAQASLSLACETLMVSRSEQLPQAGGRYAVPGRTAIVLLHDNGAQGAWAILDEGLVASSTGSIPVLLDARNGPCQGLLGSGAIIIANPGSQEALVRIESRPISYIPNLDPSHNWEQLQADGASLVLQVTPPANYQGKIRIAGAVGQAWLFSESDGKRYGAQMEPSPIGPIWTLPGLKGRIAITTAGGPLRAWLDNGNLAEDFYGKPDKAVNLILSKNLAAELSNSPQQWKFSLEREAVVVLRIDGQGLMALVNAQGQTLKAGWTAAQTSYSLLLAKGDYTLKTRPIEGQTRGGSLSLLVPNATILAEDGLANPTIISGGEAQLYSFSLKAAGKVGVGVRSRNENLRVSLLDAKGQVIDSGGLFIRDLPAGTAYLLVENLGQPQQYQALAYGLEGSNIGVPAEIQAEYRSQQSGEEE